MKTKFAILLILQVIFFSSCENRNTGELTMLTFQPENTTLEWTAFKYSEKTGVSGTFDQISVGGTKAAFHPMDVIADLHFDINTNSVNSGLDFRDDNIIDFFFSKMIGWESISGSVVGYEGDFRSGILKINLEMNNMSNIIDFDYSFNTAGVLVVEGSLQLGDFYCLEALDNMRHCCLDFHTGADGVHLLWPDVDLKITTQLEEETSSN